MREKYSTIQTMTVTRNIDRKKNNAKLQETRTEEVHRIKRPVIHVKMVRTTAKTSTTTTKSDRKSAEVKIKTV